MYKIWFNELLSILLNENKQSIYILLLLILQDSYVDGGEDYVTFSACSVNIGNAMCPKVIQNTYFCIITCVVL